jgi:hypothetical protein
MKLPPDPGGMNDARARRAGAAIRTFRGQIGPGADCRDNLSDLLCDLLHWSDRRNLDFDLALDEARDRYAEETAIEPGKEVKL